ncbi:hypothetical protein [Algoriphagus vanfongensis]|uniref:hypothetical protein n=1 Tax=Algoriphagus vanfongensis TaxID=426371 RepID=UPI0004027751|nr:hypothetical protein [Algoriphagus vanfongensis]
MSPIPKIKQFEAPEGYFEKLPSQIQARIHPKTDTPWMKWAAAAVIVLGVGLYQFWPTTSTEDELLAMDEQVNLLIDANYWTAEDILSMSDDPDELLNGIIEEEFPIVDELWLEDDLNYEEL